jgi:hypothetical protein
MSEQSAQVKAEIERAIRIGTYGKIDRSLQYEGRATPNALLKSDNHLWARMRKQERGMRVWIPLAVILGQIFLEALKFFGPMALRWLGLQ